MPKQIEFDGVIHEFPDDFTQADISNALGQSSQPAHTPMEQPVPEGVSNMAVAGEALSRQIPSNVLGAPADILNLLTETGRTGYHTLMGRGDEPYTPLPAPVGGSEWFKENVFKEVADQDQYSPGQKLLSNVATLGGEGFVGGAGLASKAKSIPEGVQVLKQAPSMIGDILKPYMDRAGGQIAQDTLAGVGAGGGLSAAEATDAGPIGTLFATLLGGVGGAGTGKAIEKGARGIHGGMETQLPDGTTVKNQALSDASKASNELVTDKRQALSNIDETLQDTEALDITNPTLGAASGDVGLGMMEVSQRTKTPQPFAERDQMLRTDIANKFGEYRNPDADVTAPQRKSSEIIDRELGQREQNISDLTGQKDLTEQQLLDLERQGDDITAPVQARRGSEGRASADLTEQLDTALDERTTLKNEKFEQSSEGAFVDADSLASLVKQVDAEAPKLAPDARLPDYIMAGINKFIPKPGTLEGPGSTAGMIPAGEVLKLRRYLSKEIQSLNAKGEHNKADTLSSFKSKINETIEADPKFKEANDFYKEEYAPFFADGYGKEFRDTIQRGQGTGKSDPGRIAKFFLGGTKSAKEDLNRIREIAPDQKSFDDAEELYFDAVLARKGNLTPKIIKNFIDDNQDVLPERLVEKYNKMNQEVLGNIETKDQTTQQIRSLGRDIKKAEADLSKTERELQSGPLGKISRFDDDKYVESILGAKDRKKQIGEVKSQIGGDKEAMDGFKEATVRWLQKRVKGTAASDTDIPETDIGGRPLVYSKLTNILDDNREALSEVFTPDEMNSLNRIHKIMSKQGNLARRATTGSDTAEKITQAQQQVMDVLEAAVKLKFGMIAGGGMFRSGKQIKRGLFGVNKRINRADKILTRMAFDPKVAKHVLEATPAQIENGKWVNDLNKLLATDEAIKEANDDNSE